MSGGTPWKESGEMKWLEFLAGKGIDVNAEMVADDTPKDNDITSNIRAEENKEDNKEVREGTGEDKEDSISELTKQVEALVEVNKQLALLGIKEDGTTQQIKTVEDNIADLMEEINS